MESDDLNVDKHEPSTARCVGTVAGRRAKILKRSRPRCTGYLPQAMQWGSQQQLKSSRCETHTAGNSVENISALGFGSGRGENVVDVNGSEKEK